MRFLVTGASGMIGFKLIERLIERFGKESVIALTSPSSTPQENQRKRQLSQFGVKHIAVDLLKPGADGRQLRKLREIDHIFHLAANLRTDIKDESNDSAIRVNDIGTVNLINSLVECLNGKLFVYTSSIGAVDRSRAESERLTEKSPCAPRTTYGKTKLRGEDIVRDKAEQFGFSHVIFRLGTVYGPNCREGHIFDQFTKWAKQGAWPARINWPGQISLVHVDDVVDVLLSTIDRAEYQGKTFFLANQESVTVGEWIQTISETLNKHVQARTLPKWLISGVNGIVYQNWFWNRMPSRLKLAAWRLSLILSNGFYCDSSRLTRIYQKPFKGVKDGVRQTLTPNTIVSSGVSA
jgi:nucleoside-diphosphate-sugar epimerase